MSLFRARSCFAWLVAGLALSCGGQSAGTGDATAPRSPTPPQLPADRVRLVTEADKPVLQLVKRTGDPQGAVAVAVFPDGGSDATVALGALLYSRLRAAGLLEVSLQTHSDGLVLATRAPNAERAQRFLSAVRTALSTPVDDDERALELADAWSAQRTERGSPGSPVGRCSGELGSDADPKKPSAPHHLAAKELEEWRSTAYAYQRVGIAAVGGEPLLDAVLAAQGDTWPSGDALVDPWPEKDDVAVVDAPAGRSLRLAWRLGDAPRALAAARALSDAEHPLRHRLQAMGPWSVSSTNAALRPRGACLRLDLTRREGKSPSARELAEVSTLVSSEVARSLHSATPEHERELSVLQPTDPLTAAALAAWSSVRSPDASGPTRRFVEYAAPSPDKRPTKDSLSTELTKTESAWSERVLPARIRVEDGQAEMWLLAASPCGTRVEERDEAGTLSLAVRAIAASIAAPADNTAVVLEPWTTPHGVGILAHGGRRDGESPEAQAERIARVVGRALAGDPLDGRVVADTRGAVLSRLNPDTGYWLAFETLTGARPSAFDPLGTWKAVSSTSASAVERARASLAEGPLQLAILANHDRAQGEAAAAALADWLAPFRADGAVCPAATPIPPSPGLWNLETVDESVREGAYVSVWATGPVEMGRATEFLFNRDGGYLDQALEKPGLVATAEARWFGGGDAGALLIELGADAAQLDAAIMQTRALLERLAAGAATAGDADIARAEQSRTDAAVTLSPRGRVVELWFERKPTPVTLEGLRNLHRAFSAERHLVVRVQRRK